MVLFFGDASEDALCSIYVVVAIESSLILAHRSITLTSLLLNVISR
jgi:hypothetical protein